MSESEDLENASPDVVDIETKFYVETEKKKTEKQKRRELERKMKFKPKKPARDEEDAGDEADENPEGEEVDYGDVKDDEADESRSESEEKEDIVVAKKRKGPKASPVLFEEGEEIEYVSHRERHAKFSIPDIEELQVFDRNLLLSLGMPEFQETRLQAVPYKRRVKDAKIVGSRPVKMRKLKFKSGKYLLAPLPRREGLTPPMIEEGEDVIYEKIPDEELQKLQDDYRAEYVEQYGGNPEDVQVPYMTPRRIVDLYKLETEDILKICRERKLKCNTLVKEIAEKFGEDEEEMEKAIRRALIYRIEQSLKKGTIIPKRSPEKYYKESPKEKVGKLKVKKNPFNKKYPFGTRVKFEDANGVERTGLVKDFAEPGITVVSERVEYKIKYTNPSLKVIKKAYSGGRERPSYMSFKGKKITEAIFRGPVTGDLREFVREAYIQILSDLRTNPENVKASSPGFFPLVMPGRINSDSWEMFYEIRFKAWRRQKLSAEVLESIDLEDIKKTAEEQTNDQRDFEKLLAIVFSNLDDEIDADNINSVTSDDIIRSFNSKTSLTPFESRFIEDFRREINLYNAVEKGKLGLGEYNQQETPFKYVKRQSKNIKAEFAARKAKKTAEKQKVRYWVPEDKGPLPKYFPDVEPKVKVLELGETDFDGKRLTGSTLADIISSCIVSYIQTNPIVEEQVLINRAVENGLEEYDQKALRKTFEKKNLESMKKEYEIARKKYKEEYAKYKASLKNKVEESVVSGEEEVIRFEEIVYNNHGKGKNTYNYLKKVLIPYLFLKGPLGDKARFFKSKLANGMIQFDALISANIAHYLPEFPMGIHNDAEIDALFGGIDPWLTLGKSLSALMRITIESFIDSYASIVDPTRRKEFNNLLQAASEVSDPIIKLLKTPSAACQQQTGTGQRPVVDENGKYVYKIIGRGKGKKRVHVMEDIPEGDLVICFSDDKFTCHSIDEVMIAMAKAKGGKVINLQTGKPYPKSFLEKFKQRYATLEGAGGLPRVPDDSEEDKPLPKTPKAKKEKIVSVKEKKATRTVHKAPKGKTFEKILGIYIVGDEIETIAGYKEEHEIPLPKGKTLALPLTNDLDTSEHEPNVAIISFDATEDPDLDELEEKINNISEDMKIYIVGVGSTNKDKKTRYSARLKKRSSRISQVFYAENNEEDILGAFTDVAIDMEGIVPRESEKVSKKSTSGAYDPEAANLDLFIPYWTPEEGWVYEEPKKAKVVKKSRKASPVKTKKSRK